jgi:hypothetical protein
VVVGITVSGHAIDTRRRPSAPYTEPEAAREDLVKALAGRDGGEGQPEPEPDEGVTVLMRAWGKI